VPKGTYGVLYANSLSLPPARPGPALPPVPWLPLLLLVAPSWLGTGCFSCPLPLPTISLGISSLFFSYQGLFNFLLGLNARPGLAVAMQECDRRLHQDLADLLVYASKKVTVFSQWLQCNITAIPSGMLQCGSLPNGMTIHHQMTSYSRVMVLSLHARMN